MPNHKEHTGGEALQSKNPEEQVRVLSNYFRLFFDQPPLGSPLGTWQGKCHGGKQQFTGVGKLEIILEVEGDCPVYATIKKANKEVGKLGGDPGAKGQITVEADEVTFKCEGEKATDDCKFKYRLTWS